MIVIMGGQVVEESYLLTVASRLNRIVQIMKVHNYAGTAIIITLYIS